MSTPPTGATGASARAGIFVGGASRRMGGSPKGLLLAPAVGAEGRVSIVERTRALVRAHCEEVVLVGRAEAYAVLGIHAIADATSANGTRAEGPLAGLVALLERARGGTVLAIACDMPYLTSEMVAHLLAFAPGAAVVAPREGDGKTWSPLFARYDAGAVSPVARALLESGERSLRAVLEAASARELPLSSEHRRALRDWDTREDMKSEAP